MDALTNFLFAKTDADMLKIANEEILKLKEENQELRNRLVNSLKTGIYENMENYHFAIKTFRQALKITQTELAERLGMEQSNYTRIESGKTKMTVEMLLKISVILRCDICDLLKFEVIP